MLPSPTYLQRARVPHRMAEFVFVPPSPIVKGAALTTALAWLRLRGVEAEVACGDDLGGARPYRGADLRGVRFHRSAAPRSAGWTRRKSWVAVGGASHLRCPLTTVVQAKGAPSAREAAIAVKESRIGIGQMEKRRRETLYIATPNRIPQDSSSHTNGKTSRMVDIYSMSSFDVRYPQLNLLMVYI